MTDPSRCTARVSRSGYRDYACHRTAKTERQNQGVCTQHARIYDKWDADPKRDAAGMAAFWWGWHVEREDA